jgi:hypothetical protein
MTGPRPAGRQLEHRVAVVTGASSGIGRAIALALGVAGASVIAVGRDAQRLDDTAAEATAAGSLVEVFSCDLTDDAAVRALSAAWPPPGSPGHSGHCAGTIDFRAVGTSASSIVGVRTNLRGPYLWPGAAAAAPPRRGRRLRQLERGIAASAGVACRATSTPCAPSPTRR